MNLHNAGENKESIIITDLYSCSSWIPPILGEDQASTEQKVHPLSKHLASTVYSKRYCCN